MFKVSAKVPSDVAVSEPVTQGAGGSGPAKRLWGGMERDPFTGYLEELFVICVIEVSSLDLSFACCRTGYIICRAQCKKKKCWSLFKSSFLPSAVFLLISQGDSICYLKLCPLGHGDTFREGTYSCRKLFCDLTQGSMCPHSGLCRGGMWQLGRDGEAAAKNLCVLCLCTCSVAPSDSIYRAPIQRYSY